MGCAQSTSNDVQRSKVDENNNNKKAAGPSSSNPSAQPAIIANKQKSPDNLQLGQSYSEMKIGESEMFKDIIERTAANFIDISQTGAPTENNNAVRDISSQVKLTESIKKKLYGLPAAAEHASIGDVLTRESVTDNDVELFNRLADSFKTCLEEMKIEDVGELVVSFEVDVQ
eukprot:GEZU01001196.1.p1 GENE.GEZU01001196.1~~GEZU01001196.1.p1  ORF type:complete len:172 (+),score=47.09 GEZU01001196.1:104-619(+)